MVNVERLVDAADDDDRERNLHFEGHDLLIIYPSRDPYNSDHMKTIRRVYLVFENRHRFRASAETEKKKTKPKLDASGIRPAKAEHFDIFHLANQITEYHDEIVYWAQETAHHIPRSISPALNVAEPHSMDDAAFGSRPSALRADADEAQTSD